MVPAQDEIICAVLSNTARLPRAALSELKPLPSDNPSVVSNDAILNLKQPLTQEKSSKQATTSP